MPYALTQHSRETPTRIRDPFGSPAQKGWDEASARRFTPYPALCGASRCSVFVTALYEIEGILTQGMRAVKTVYFLFTIFLIVKIASAMENTMPIDAISGVP